MCREFLKVIPNHASTILSFEVSVSSGTGYNGSIIAICIWRRSILSFWIKEIKRGYIGRCCDITLGDEVGLLILNKLNEFVWKSEDSQQEEDEDDIGEGTFKSDDDGELCGDRYRNERNQLILSPVELENIV